MKYHEFIVVLAVICILLKIEGNFFDITNMYNACFMDRNDVNFVHINYLGFNVLFVAKMLILLIFIAVSYLNPRVGIKQSIYMFVWYAITNLFVQYFKIWLEDTTCGKGKPNSISGHYSFFGFYMLTFPCLFNTIPLIYSSRRSFTLPAMVNFLKDKRLLESLISIFYIIFCLLSLYTVFETWKYGYHSHNQIINGLLVALASHYICSIVLTIHLKNPTSIKVLIYSILLKIIAFVILNLVLGYVPINFSKML